MIFFDAALEWLAHGLWDIAWWQIVLFALALTHITMISVTVFLHRHQAHRALDLHPIASHFFRLWLWLTTGQVTKEWAAIHRKHHAKCEQADDPHSPHVHGIKTVLTRGAELYRAESKNKDTLARYGHGTPDDWIERNLYTRFSWQGVGLMMVIDLALFGMAGLAVWALQMAWTPIMAAGIINGAGHYWGYRNFRGDRRQHQFVALGHHHCGRRVAQQPPHLPDLGQAVDQALRVRHWLDVHHHSQKHGAWPVSRKCRLNVATWCCAACGRRKKPWKPSSPTAMK
jgi:fatty-acid desaturase